MRACAYHDASLLSYNLVVFHTYRILIGCLVHNGLSASAWARKVFDEFVCASYHYHSAHHSPSGQLVRLFTRILPFIIGSLIGDHLAPFKSSN